jgi:hypothetical protein
MAHFGPPAGSLNEYFETDRGVAALLFVTRRRLLLALFAPLLRTIALHDEPLQVQALVGEAASQLVFQ